MIYSIPLANSMGHNADSELQDQGLSHDRQDATAGCAQWLLNLVQKIHTPLKDG